MEWLFDPSGKSVASNAQRIVADMHYHMASQAKRVKDLEQTIAQLQHMCTESLENEINRLELRREDTIMELRNLEEAILEKKDLLNKTKQRIREILQGDDSKSLENDSIDKSNLSDLSCRKDSNISTDMVAQKILSNHQNAVPSPMYVEPDSMEEDFVEEAEMLASVRNIEPNFLFLVHRNNSDDVIVYHYVVDKSNREGNTNSNNTTPSPATPNFVSCYKLNQLYDKSSAEPLTSFERLMSYGVHIIPIQNRDESKVMEIQIPHVKHNHLYFSNSSQYNKNRSYDHNYRLDANIGMDNSMRSSSSSTAGGGRAGAGIAYGINNSNVSYAGLSSDAVKSKKLMRPDQPNTTSPPLYGKYMVSIDLPIAPNVIIDIWQYFPHPSSSQNDNNTSESTYGNYNKSQNTHNYENNGSSAGLTEGRLRNHHPHSSTNNGQLSSDFIHRRSDSFSSQGTITNMNSAAAININNSAVRRPAGNSHRDRDAMSSATPGATIRSGSNFTSKTSGATFTWATTTVDSIKFAVVERIYVVSELRWGIPTTIQVELFARHPTRGTLLMETIHLAK